MSVSILLTAGHAAPSPQQPEAEVATRIRDAAMNHSQIMETVSYLTDVIGPRLTGSPNLKRVEEFARDKLREWAVANAHLESWGPFGRGWSLEGLTANVISPGFSPLIAYPKAWSPGTNGTVRSEAIFLDVKSVADLDKYKGKLKGKVVLFSEAREVDPLFMPQARRQTDEELLRLANARPFAARGPFQFSPQQRAAEELNFRKWQLLSSEGAAVVLQPSALDGGTVLVTAATVPYLPDVPFEKRAHAWGLNKPPILPQVVVSAEQYNRILRLVARGNRVELEVNIAVRFHDADPMSYNVIAEIPGTDLRDEVVMIGGCIDSWHAGSGATDNAAGAASVLEIMRLFQSLGLKPRRTIRLGLWSAEEQGAFGSQAYVAAHFIQKRESSGRQSDSGRPAYTPEHEKFDAYFNFDYGTGRIRGIYLQGNTAALPMFRSILGQINDPAVATLSFGGVGASDHIPFDQIGLPGFQWIRDYMEGRTRAAHTNMDTYEHVLEDDLKQSVAFATTFIYELAMRDEKVPRKPPEK